MLRNAEDTREQLAAVLTDPRNERFAQVVANRLWKRLLGFGIVDPVDDSGSMFPTGRRVDELEVPGGRLRATLINAGVPAVFLNAADLGYAGTEPREAINGDPAALARFEALRTAAALRMGIIKTPEEAATSLRAPAHRGS